MSEPGSDTRTAARTGGRRFLLLHGYGNHRPQDHWQWWLAEQLRQHGEQVLYPQLPEPDQPDLEAWLRALQADYDQLGIGERVVICHSLGCVLWYQAALRRLLPVPADRVLLVAPPGPSVMAGPDLRGFDPGAWRADVLTGSSHRNIRLVASDDDPFCLEGPAAVVFGTPLGLDAETLHGAGHLSVADGYGPWPAALEWCLNESHRFDS